MAPVPNLEHQDIATGLVTVLRVAIDWTGLGKVYGPANVSDRELGWDKNFRYPRHRRSLERHMRHGFAARISAAGPDFLVEVMSQHDLARDKLPFYAGVAVRELLIIDRDPWCLELYRLGDKELKLVGRIQSNEADQLRSDVLPMAFQLLPGDPRPQIEVIHHDGRQRWIV